ncbi:MAG: type II toxin-antitoxin system VapC family toxin [Pirellulales bacterium]
MASSFLDTSALVKRYHVEEGTSEVDRRYNDPQHALIVSRLGFVEVLSALATKVRTGVLSHDAHDAARKRFLGDVKSRRLSVMRLLAIHYRDAERLIDRHAKTRRFRTLDALQLSAALDLHHQGRFDTFVCADQALCEIAVLEGLATMNPAASS